MDKTRFPDNLGGMTRAFAISLCAGLLAGVPWPLEAKDSEALDLARKLNTAFIEVAETVTPSVVVIRVSHRPGKFDFSLDFSDEKNPFWEMVPRRFRDYFKEQFEKEHPAPKTPQPKKRETFRHPPVFDGEGSGIILREDGYILTNFHVVEEAEQILVRFRDGREYEAEVRGTDAQSDIAVLKMKAKDLKLKPCVLGDSSKVRVGEFAIAIGAPFDLDYSVTFGHVSAKGRSQVVPDRAMDQDFIQTDANINPGNSGGPLVNINGEVIGINTLIRGLHTGIGFAVPINLAREVSDKLILEGKYVRAWLGVGIAALKDYKEYQELVKQTQAGVVVTEIVAEGPAAQSDLQMGDIITSVDGQAVANAMELKTQIRVKKIGAPVTLKVVRLTNGKEKPLELKVRPGAWPEQKPAVTATEKPAETEPHLFGLTVETLTAEAAKAHKAEQTKGVIVSTVQKESEAEKKGFKAGDIITAVNQKPVADPGEFLDLMKAASPKKGVLLTLIRNGTSTFEILKEASE